MKLKNMRKDKVERFVKKYEKVAPTYPEYIMMTNNTLKKILCNQKAKELIKLNNRLKLNDSFAHEVIDKLLNSKNPITLCEISCLSIFIGYRKDDAIKVVKENLKKTNKPIYVILRKAFLYSTCNIEINEI